MTQTEARVKYRKIVDFILKRYTVNGRLIVNEGDEYSPYAKYEIMAWNKYVLGYRSGSKNKNATK